MMEVGDPWPLKDREDDDVAKRTAAIRMTREAMISRKEELDKLLSAEVV